MLVVNEQISIPSRELTFTYSRSPGPGGQNVNKVNTKAMLSWQLDESKSLAPEVIARLKMQNKSRLTRDGKFIITSHRFRDQSQNVDDCLAKLRDMIAAALVVPKKRKKTKPSRNSKLRRLDSKKKKSEKKSSRSANFRFD